MNQVFSEKGMLRAKIYKKKLFSHTFKYNINKMSKTKKIVSLNKYYLLRLEKRQKNKCIIHKKMAFILDK